MAYRSSISFVQRNTINIIEIKLYLANRNVNINSLQEAIRNHEVINILQTGGEAASAGGGIS
jgi:hypothetical protein